ncbi:MULTISPECIES: hypothetical protein [unclassified Streptomyces]|nr:hypothetical protein [Streptomyces sp. NBC_00223]
MDNFNGLYLLKSARAPVTSAFRAARRRTQRRRELGRHGRPFTLRDEP